MVLFIWYSPRQSTEDLLHEASADLYYEYLSEKYKDRATVGVGGCGDDDGLYRGEQMGDTKLVPTRQYFHRKSKSMLQAWPERTPRYE